jgi:hypothetical protein
VNACLLACSEPQNEVMTLALVATLIVRSVIFIFPKFVGGLQQFNSLLVGSDLDYLLWWFAQYLFHASAINWHIFSSVFTNIQI